MDLIFQVDLLNKPKEVPKPNEVVIPDIGSKLILIHEYKKGYVDTDFKPLYREEDEDYATRIKKMKEFNTIVTSPMTLKEVLIPTFDQQCYDPKKRFLIYLFEELPDFPFVSYKFKPIDK